MRISKNNYYNINIKINVKQEIYKQNKKLFNKTMLKLNHYNNKYQRYQLYLMKNNKKFNP